MRAAARLPALVLCVASAALGQSPDLTRYAADLRAAEGLLSRGDFQGVVEKLRPWPERLPERPEARHFLGLAHYRLRDFEAAIRHLSAAMQREERGSAAWRQTVEVLGAAHYFEGQWQDAEPLLEQAAAARPEDSELLYTLAMTHLHLGRSDKARIAFAGIFQVDPETPQAYALAARLALQENRLDEAEALLRGALAMQPALPGAAYRLGTVALRRGGYAEAERLLHAELQRNPGHAAAWHSLGEAKSGLGKQAEAVEALRRAVWLDTQSYDSYVLLARIHVDELRFELAEDVVRRAIEVSPLRYEAHFLQSRIFYKTGRPDRAKEHLATAERIRRSAGQSNR